MKLFKGLSLAFCLTLLTIANSACGKELVLAANFWEPFTGQGLSDNGFASQLVKTVLEKKGHQVDIIIMPWARILHLLQSGNGKIDGVVSIWHTLEREKYVLLSEAYYHNELCLVKHNDSPFEFHTINDFKGKLIGVGRNYDYSDELNKATHFQRAESVTLSQNLLRLAKKRIDLVLTDCVIGRYHLEQLRNSGELRGKLTLMNSVIDTRPLYFGLSPTVPEAQQIISDFNEGLEVFINSDELVKLYEFWNIPPPDKN